jgi:hypothetical protein
VLAKSPAVAALDVAERVFPALRPSEIVDRHPLLAPPALALGAERGRSGRPAEHAPAPGGLWPACAFGALVVLGGAGFLLGRAA